MKNAGIDHAHRPHGQGQLTCDSGDVITGLGDVQRDCPGVMVFHAGVKQRGADLVTAGGRVLTVVATAPSFEIAIARAYEAASKIHFDGMQFRRDIGQKALS